MESPGRSDEPREGVPREGVKGLVKNRERRLQVHLTRAPLQLEPQSESLGIEAVLAMGFSVLPLSK